MAAEVQNGLALVQGIANDGTAITVSGFASIILDGAKAGHKFDLDEIKDEIKFDTNLMATNPRLELTLTFKPAGGRGAVANTRAGAATQAVVLTPLAKVTLTHFKIAAFNGDWVYIGDEEIDLSQGPVAMSLKIRKYDDATQNTSLTTVVVG